MDEFFDDNPFDLDRPEELTLAATGGALADDEPRCSCACGCRRPTDWPDDECRRCQDGRHDGALDPDDAGARRSRS